MRIKGATISIAFWSFSMITHLSTDNNCDRCELLFSIIVKYCGVAGI
jgi:hypothetical protein